MKLRLLALLLLSSLLPCPAAARDKLVRVAVLENAPPMAYRDTNGKFTGFSIGIARAVCDELPVECEFQATSLDRVVDALAAGEFDIAAVSLLETPERRARILFAKPYFRSFSVWIAKPGIMPGDKAAHVTVVKGSAQERYALGKKWATVPVSNHTGLLATMTQGTAQAALVPMITSMNLRKDKDFADLGLTTTIMHEPELGGDAAFGINPRRADLKPLVDAALEKIKRNGSYDRINSQFLPFRVN